MSRLLYTHHTRLLVRARVAPRSSLKYGALPRHCCSLSHRDTTDSRDCLKYSHGNYKSQNGKLKTPTLASVKRKAVPLPYGFSDEVTGSAFGRVRSRRFWTSLKYKADYTFFRGNLFSLDITCVCGSLHTSCMIVVVWIGTVVQYTVLPHSTRHSKFFYRLTLFLFPPTFFICGRYGKVLVIAH